MNITAPYRLAVGVAVATTLILIWMALGVGVLGADGDRANAMYAGVLAVGIIGAAISRLQPEGMARTLAAMAVAQSLVVMIALIAGVHRTGASPIAEIVLLNGFFVAMFLGAAWLFRNAARGQPDSVDG